jgi:hypothetical protein
MKCFDRSDVSGCTVFFKDQSLLFPFGVAKTFLKANVGLGVHLQPMSRLCVGLLRSSSVCVGGRFVWACPVQRSEGGWRRVFRTIPIRTEAFAVLSSLGVACKVMCYEPRLSPQSGTPALGALRTTSKNLISVHSIPRR